LVGDAPRTPIEILDFYPYGSTRIDHGAPGYNAMLPTTRLYRQAVGTLTAVRDYLSQIVGKLQK